MIKKIFILMVCVVFAFVANAQLMKEKQVFTKSDTLRGSNNDNRDWWDVQHYDITVKPDYATKTIEGSCTIKFKVLKEGKTMQIDLQDSLVIDLISISTVGNKNRSKNIYNDVTYYKAIKKDGVDYVNVSSLKINSIQILNIKYHGKPREAVNPPWDGGWIWTKDSLGNPWMSVACQGLGASSWFPCKDLQSDEPDSGAILTIIAPDSLNVIGNGRLIKIYKPPFPDSHAPPPNHTEWEVKNPINTYDIIPYIGKYSNFNDTLGGEGGKLDLSYWVLTYNLDKAKKQFTQVKPMLHCFEYWFGKYPFYEDSYKLVEAPYLGMENQSDIAYGNGYQNGYKGRDLSRSGWGLKWDFIIVHESAHEWWGNSITSKDIADMWIHESFANYAETLYTEWLFGKEAGEDY
jgi:aminopeptidase N